MGKFDGIFIASDWDSTLFVNGSVSQKNIEAIRYFQENGGKFTVCSGRYLEYLKRFKDVVAINTYTICYNGAFIINTETNDILYQGFCDDYLFDILDKIFSMKLHYKTISVYDDVSPTPIEYTVDEFLLSVEEQKKKKIYKVLLRSDSPEHADVDAKKVNSLDLRDYIAVRSWNISLEIQQEKNSKGMAIKRVAEKEGCKLIVAIGDYENDITMLRDAHIGYAVTGSAPTLIPYADRITVSADEDAIAKVIEDIEKEFCKN